jgi:hypothetical protein
MTAKTLNHTSSTVEIDLNEPNAIVVIGLVPEAVNKSNDELTVMGTLEGKVDSSCRLIRMVPLFTNGPAYDAIVLQNQFMVVGAKPGKYAVAVTGPSGICRLCQVTIYLGG